MKRFYEPKTQVRVHWLDSKGGPSWSWYSSFKPEVAKCVSLGFVVSHDKDQITIAGHVHDFDKEDFAIDGFMTIPLFAVTKIEPL